MVIVRFLHLLRSKYNIKEIEVNSGTINDIIAQIQVKYPKINLKDFENSVVFIDENKIIHSSRFDEVIIDGQEVVFTHFLGGG